MSLYSSLEKKFCFIIIKYEKYDLSYVKFFSDCHSVLSNACKSCLSITNSDEVACETVSVFIGKTLKRYFSEKVGLPHLQTGQKSLILPN